MLVRAKELGIVNASRVRPGTVFDWPGDKCPRWCEVVEADAAPEKPVTEPEGDIVIAGKRGKRQPRTFSEANQ